MVENLLREVEARLGRKVKAKGDCHHLSDCVLEATGEFISYNTLRRLYGLAPAVNPRVGTLNVLSRFLGYRDHAEYAATSQINARWHALELALQWDEGNQEEALWAHLGSLESSAVAVDVALHLCRSWLASGRQDMLVRLLALPRYQSHSLTYSEQLHLAHSMGMLFRSQEVGTPELLRSPHFQDNVYTLFVDYSALSGYMGRWNAWYLHEGAANPQHDVFNAALGMLRRHLNREPMGQLDLKGTPVESLHPILRSRVFTVKWLSEPWSDPQALWLAVHGATPPAASARMSSFHEIFFVTALQADVALLGWLMDDVDIVLQGLVHHEHHDLQLYRLVEALHHGACGRQREMASVLASVQLGMVNLAMRDAVTLLWHAAHVGADLDGAEGHQEAYRSLVRKLDWPLLDGAFPNRYRWEKLDLPDGKANL